MEGEGSGGKGGGKWGMGTPCRPPPLIYVTGIIVCLMHYFQACLFYCIRQGLTFKKPKVINESCLLRYVF